MQCTKVICNEIQIVARRTIKMMSFARNHCAAVLMAQRFAPMPYYSANQVRIREKFLELAD